MHVKTKLCCLKTCLFCFVLFCFVFHIIHTQFLFSFSLSHSCCFDPTVCPPISVHALTYSTSQLQQIDKLVLVSEFGIDSELEVYERLHVIVFDLSSRQPAVMKNLQLLLISIRYPKTGGEKI